MHSISSANPLYTAITLNSGNIVKCSPQHYEELSRYSWHEDKGYARSMIDGKMVGMHRFIMKAQKGQTVDHIDRDKYNCCIENLRFVTSGQNAANHSKQKNRSSIYYGVTFMKATGKYRVRFIHEKREITLGQYISEKEAAEVYDRYICQNPEMVYHVLNFPNTQEYMNTARVIPKVKNGTSSGYYGVVQRNNRFYASVGHKGIKQNLGHFDEKEKAAITVDSYIVKHGLNRRLNFPATYTGYTPVPKIKTIFQPYAPGVIQIIIPSRIGIVVLIDEYMYEKIQHCTCNETPYGYIEVHMGKRVKHQLHRYLKNVTDPNILIDHINGNKYDNRISNLIESDAQLNANNKRKRASASSKFYGVSKYLQGFQCFFKGLTLDTSQSEIDMARKRDLYVLTFHPNERFKMNFEWTQSDIDQWVTHFELLEKPIIKKTSKRQKLNE